MTRYGDQWAAGALSPGASLWPCALPSGAISRMATANAANQSAAGSAGEECASVGRLGQRAISSAADTAWPHRGAGGCNCSVRDLRASHVAHLRIQRAVQTAIAASRSAGICPSPQTSDCAASWPPRRSASVITTCDLDSRRLATRGSARSSEQYQRPCRWCDTKLRTCAVLSSPFG
jgi:hypothetical protein